MNDSAYIKCNKITIDNKYNKILSKSVTMSDTDKSVEFEFEMNYDEDYESFTFIVSLILDTDDGESRFHYKAKDNNISITLYNPTPNQSSDYTIFCSKRQFMHVKSDSIKFYIMPKVTIYSNNFKDINIDIYSEEI